MACRHSPAEHTLRIKAAALMTGVSLTLLSMLILSGCSATEQATVDTPVSAREAFAQDQELLSSLQSDYELIKQVSSQLSTSNIYDQRLQPVNKREKCLIPFMVSHQDGVQLYWDGSCKNGYASGLGRMVRTLNGHKIDEFLLDVIYPHQLVAYLQYDLENMDAEAGYSELKLENEQLTGYSATLGYNVQQWHNGSFNISYRYEDTTNLVSFTKVLDLLSGEVSSIIAYPNFSHELLSSHDNVLSTIDRTYRLLEGQNMVGFGYIWLKNGQVVMRNAANGQDSIVGSGIEQLDDYVADIESQVNKHTDLVDPLIDRGLKQIETYRNQKCKKHRALFKGDEVSAVCEYLDEFKDNYQKMQQAQEQRIQRLDSYKNQQQQRLEELEQHLKGLKISLNAQ